jgi:hypothetical protein
MIDWIKLISKYSPFIERIVNDSRFRWSVCHKPEWGNLICERDGFTIGVNEIRGEIKVGFSLHKYHNSNTGGGNQNYNDFTFQAICSAVNLVAEYFGNEIMYADIINFEFGVNITPPVDTFNLLSGLHSHRREPFVITQDSGQNYYNCIHNHYRVKVYDKGLQRDIVFKGLSEYDTSDPLLRFELHFDRMAKLRPLGVNVFADLLTPDIYPRLQSLLLAEWNNILFIDETISKASTAKKNVNLKKWLTHNFWTDFNARCKAKKTPKKYNTEVDKYRKYINAQTEGLQRITATSIIHKWEFLTATKSTPEPVINGISNHYNRDIGLIIPTSRQCKVTGLPIDHQPDRTEFITAKSIKWVYQTDIDTFNRVLLPYLGAKYLTATVDVQCEKIYKAIRNVDSNNRNHAKEAINRILSVPSLFDNVPFIRPEILQRAEINF